MSFPASWRALGRLAGWALPVLAGLFLAQSAARAECGDYVVTRLPHDGRTAAPAREMPPAPHKPCSGPLCSQAPVAPTAPAPPAQPETAQEWGCAPSGLAFAPLDPTATLAARNAARPVRLPRRIFHPPRLVA
jgi:hypothetical protein